MNYRHSIRNNKSENIKYGKKYCFLTLIFIQGIAIALLFINPTAFAATVNPCTQGMVLIPGGTFKMGSDNSSFVEERSPGDVTAGQTHLNYS
ncbi:hypothetical protein [Nostoc sphaeroides]|uniref:Formylglycine-generating enzyme family protein n=1 Tax=Nostoc sphaeroides CCNUC1 TaxID=2653204 RepID=A0A5P8WCZ4_9NOSO|nr:hypothetical protein [Nostoc sphaeroides]QFS50026.1 formylglycine-generating enzyme family protein [Nostoc sphaeroides CCNUC1]